MGILLAKKMKYFMVTMEKRNFSQAADDLCITRSPLSKVITEIENWIGGQLFIRKHNDLEPTPLAWNFYHKCKPLYFQLLSLESECSFKKNNSTLTFHFDISIPEILFRQWMMIAQVEKIDAKFTRGVVSLEDGNQLKYQCNHVIISLRPLTCSYQNEQSSWEGSSLMLLQDKRTTLKNDCHIYIWQDKYIDYMKERYSFILNNININPLFIEHNWDVPSLLYAVRSGKGRAIMPQKMALMFKTEDINYQIITGYRPRIYIHSNIDKSQHKKLEKMKGIISSLL